jgi:hypothetical protein
MYRTDNIYVPYDVDRYRICPFSVFTYRKAFVYLLGMKTYEYKGALNFLMATIKRDNFDESTA